MTDREREAVTKIMNQIIKLCNSQIAEYCELKINAEKTMEELNVRRSET